MLSRQATQFKRPQEHPCEHRPVQPSGVRIAQRRMVAAEQRDAVGQRILGGVGEGIGGASLDDAFVEQVREIAIPRDLAKADDDAHPGKRCHLGGQVGRAGAYLLRRRLIAGWGAANDRTNPNVAQLKAVVAANGSGFASEAEFMQHRIHEVSGAVAGERAAGAVGSVSSWCKAENKDAGLRIAESGHRLGPVFLVAIRFPTSLPDTTNVRYQAGTPRAARDVLLDLIEDWEGRFCDRPLGAHEESSLKPANCFITARR